MQNEDKVLKCPTCGKPQGTCKCKPGGGGDGDDEDSSADNSDLETSNDDSFAPFMETNTANGTRLLVDALIKCSILSQSQGPKPSGLNKVDDDKTVKLSAFNDIKLTFDQNVLQRGYKPDFNSPLTLEAFGKLTGLIISDSNGEPLDSQTAKSLLGNQEFLQIAGKFSEDQQKNLNESTITNNL